MAHGSGAIEHTDTGAVWITGELGLRCELKPYVKLIVKIHHSDHFIIVLAKKGTSFTVLSPLFS